VTLSEFAVHQIRRSFARSISLPVLVRRDHGIQGFRDLVHPSQPRVDEK
jgi:hypothetical protein